MADNNWVTASYPGYDQEIEHETDKVFTMTRNFNCATTNMTGSDVYQVFKVGVGVLVWAASVTVTTAEGDAATLDIGDGADTTLLETDANLNSAGHTWTADAVKLYTAADTIDIIPSVDLDTAVFRVTIFCARVTT
jgi:hypothetical protein